MSSTDQPLVIAHRGSSAALPEHTRAAYVCAIAEGADGLECDVRLSADGELVCLHDRTLSRVGGSDRVVSTMSLAELRAVDWGAWRGTDRVAGDGDLLTLRELVELALAAGRPLELLVETKHPTRFGGQVEHAVAALLTDHGLTGPASGDVPRVAMMSFSPSAVRRMTGLLPDLPTVLLVGAPEPSYLRRGALLGGAGTAGLDIDLVRRRPEVVAGLLDGGHEVYVWTVDDDADIALVRRLGVSGIITNRPLRVKHALDSQRLKS